MSLSLSLVGQGKRGKGRESTSTSKMSRGIQGYIVGNGRKRVQC